MNREATSINTEPHRIVDKRERDKREQCCNTEQTDADTGKHAVDLLDEFVLITHLCYTWIGFQLLGYPLKRIVVGIVGRVVAVTSAQGNKVVKGEIVAFVEGAADAAPANEQVTE